MRRAFAACFAFLALMVIVAVRFGCRDSSPEVPAQPVIVDAGTSDAPVDAAVMPPDAAPPPKRRTPAPVPKPTRKPPRSEPTPPKPTPPKPPPVRPPPKVPPPVVPSPGRPRCLPANPAGCPATEPNVNRPCDAEGARCVYGPSCCPPIYVCNNGVFEAWFTTCP
ncbi:MAG TPA: hypothetical protein VK427_26710 [Kofleriaceae bacterium]|nr:hypothetical protein [Kofleriaceae bacterium]